MPTPFFHLLLAEDLYLRIDLPGSMRQFLEIMRGEFLFGNTAPDVQVISGQTRLATHFFDIPIHPGHQLPWELFLLEQPGLAAADTLPGSQAAFLAGYLCHLQADWLWVKDIFTPYFGPRCPWGTFHQRLFYHNVLRSYLDQRTLRQLPAGMDARLSHVKPDGWLPFVLDRHLVELRDLLYPQLAPGAEFQTVEVFSSRQGISAPEYYALLDSEERMQREVFDHFPLVLINSYRQRVLEANLRLLTGYMAFTLHPIQPSIGEQYKESRHEAY